MTRQPEPVELLGAFARSGDGVYAVDHDQKIIFWNKTAERVLGHKAADVLGQRCFDVIAGGDYLGHPFCGADCDVIVCARKGRAVPNYDVRTKTAGGEARWLNISIVVLAGRKKQSTIAVHLLRDITEQRRKHLPPLALGEGASPDGHAALAKLTRREAEVLQHLSAGLNNAQIAEILGTSTTTVRNHIEHLLAKLGVHSKLEAVVFAARHRIV